MSYWISRCWLEAKTLTCFFGFPHLTCLSRGTLLTTSLHKEPYKSNPKRSSRTSYGHRWLRQLRSTSSSLKGLSAQAMPPAGTKLPPNRVRKPPSCDTCKASPPSVLFSHSRVLISLARVSQAKRVLCHPSASGCPRCVEKGIE